jgi:hypothetical protein
MSRGQNGFCSKRQMICTLFAHDAVTSWKIPNKAKGILDHFGHLSLAKSQVTCRFGQKMFRSCDVQLFTPAIEFRESFLLVDV